MIRLEKVNVEYNQGFKALRDISLTINDGEAVGLIGANGAGKTTLMSVIMGLVGFEGSIMVDDIPLEKKNYDIIRRKIGIVIQNSDNQMFMPTVYEDLMFGPLNYGIPREIAEKKADEILDRFGISELKKRHNHRLSGGEKRMAAIATVLAMDPETVLMDEPSSSLDPYNRRLIINTINSLTVTKLIASHDLDLILDTCSRVILLSKGKIVADGNAEVILRDRELLEANRMELPLRYSN
ncbi:MAG: energy-coupling factor ABC transporter ATP-binding protein [Lachnospiraceae bacterium]|nr:energy-coupling factor ABC transporter ATP-binding protein [Lachnospiraceae bacterium]